MEELDTKSRADDGARGIVEMLFCTSLIALVGAADQPQSSPRKLQIVNTKVSVYYAYSKIPFPNIPP
jgi:autophagy-related protein 18